MRLYQMKPNAHILDSTTPLSGTRRTLFSYETPVGYYWAGRVWLLTNEGINNWMLENGLETKKSYSTTRKHQNLWLDSLKGMGLITSDDFVHWVNVTRWDH